MDVRLGQCGLPVATALDARPLIDFCRSPEAIVALPPGSGPLVGLLTDTPEAHGKDVAKAADEAGQVSCSRPAGSGLGWPLPGLMLGRVTATRESGHWGFRGPRGSARLSLGSVTPGRGLTWSFCGAAAPARINRGGMPEERGVLLGVPLSPSSCLNMVVRVPFL